jgi:hypothetical protein
VCKRDLIKDFRSFDFRFETIRLGNLSYITNTCFRRNIIINTCERFINYTSISALSEYLWSAELALKIGAIILVIVIIWELLVPTRIKEGFVSRIEGFQDMITPVDSNSSFIGKFFPARGDIGENIEEKGYIQDPRYFKGYVDVQQLGLNKDFCRMVVPKGAKDDSERFFACALAGTEGLSSVRFRTPSAKQGFRHSRDDYMRDINKSGASAYCSIVKVTSNSFEPRCYTAYDTQFNEKDVLDPEPPANIKHMLNFYDGIMVWLRMRDDLVDYAKNLYLTGAGEIEKGMDEAEVNPVKTDGLQFNGVDQFLRVGDNKNLNFNTKVPLRFMRAVSVWVKFDEFTNNAHIFDFGMGAANNNVFLGIYGKGDGGISSGNLKSSDLLCDREEGKTVPSSPSGAQPVAEVSPQKLMETTDADVDEWVCPLPEVLARNLPSIKGQPGQSEKATLIYEVWEGRQRAMSIKIPGSIPLGIWTHIAITAFDNDPIKPDIHVYINGVLRHAKVGGVLPQTSFTEKNYIGKSNWSTDTSMSQNADELFKGAMFDFRMYNKVMDAAKIKATYDWGKVLLNTD